MPPVDSSKSSARNDSNTKATHDAFASAHKFSAVREEKKPSVSQAMSHKISPSLCH